MNHIVKTALLVLAVSGGMSAQNLTHKSVTLKKNLQVYSGGQIRYTAKKGDTLYVVKEKRCRSNPMQKCLEVRHRKYGTGFVRKKELLR